MKAHKRYSFTGSWPQPQAVVGRQRQAPAALPPGKEFQVSIVEEDAWATLLVWTRMEEKISYPHRGSIHGTSNPQRVAVPTELSRPPDLCSSLTVTEVKQRKKNNKGSVQLSMEV